MSKRPVFGRRLPAVVALAALGAVGAACGGGGEATSPSNTPITTILPTQPFNVAPDALAFADVTIDGAGFLTCTADWTLASNDIDIYVTATSCVAGDIAGLLGCPAMGRTTAVSTKPERLTVSVNQGNYRVWIANYGPGVESGTLDLMATVRR